ncbi:uncharacterized protein LOC111276079 [Durio zibethinus]|uniref:Uncharacterized protein LOC111276079 n=1 Tax=Durio zibethinus TaxID=66656 RepID=A0A6P5WN98_DURZI|nr:uncharacterized protein LOC111276079 [Durio zibethinus]
MTLFSDSHLQPTPAIKKRCFKLRKRPKSSISNIVSRRHRMKLHFQEKIRRKEMITRLMELKVKMKETSEEQKFIKEGQRKVREKFEAIENECEQLRKETNLLIQQSTHTQLRLVLMFKILKAREESDFTKSAQLTQLLRVIIARTTSSIK